MANHNPRVALVTGGTKGIGLAIARALAQAGNHVAVSARNESDVERVATELSEIGGGTAQGIVCDVRDPAACARMWTIIHNVGAVTRTSNAKVRAFTKASSLRLCAPDERLSRMRSSSVSSSISTEEL